MSVVQHGSAAPTLEERDKKLTQSFSRMDGQDKALKPTAAGFLFIGGGILVVNSVDQATNDNPDDNGLAVVNGVLGTLGMGLGALVFFVNAETYEQKLFREYKERANTDLAAKVEFGEREFGALAGKYRSTRISSSLSDFALGAGLFAWGLSSNEKFEPTLSNKKYWGSIFAIAGVVTLFIKRPTEYEFDSYESWMRSESTQSMRNPWSMDLAVHPAHTAIQINYHL